MSFVRFLNMKFLIGIIFLLGLNFWALGSPLPVDIKGPDFSGLNQTRVEIGEKKGLVVVFLSAKCPCSNSHVEELKKLKTDFPDFSFVGIHSNMDENEIDALKYFKEIKLSFPVIQDNKATYADQFTAFKTPHSFVLNKQGEILYQGGVSDSHSLESSNKLFLREALEDISKGAKVRSPEGRTLGCFIVRKKI